VRIGHLGIYARNVEALANWYRDVLNFEVVTKLENPDRPPIYFLKSRQGVEIEILPTTKERRIRELRDPGFSHICITVDSFEEFATYLESKGISLHGVRDTSAGWKIGYFEDPEGNVLEIMRR
jgi:catechol 2,3-dioxygenase-like lactoylglutathione lyase family enzyme